MGNEGQHLDFKEWSNHILIELKRLDKEVRTTNGLLLDIRVELAMLKVKSGMWGSIGALLVMLPTLVIYFLTK